MLNIPLGPINGTAEPCTPISVIVTDIYPFSRAPASNVIGTSTF